MKKNHKNSDLVRNIIFGLEDGFVSTSGVLFGIATATFNSRYIFIAGVITVIVEASSMGIGAYLSEKEADELTKSNHVKRIRQIIDGIVMFSAYLIAGIVCISPYLIWDVKTAMIISVSITMLGLFFVGYLPKQNIARGVEVTLLAGFAILIGYAAGNWLQQLDAVS